MSVAVSSLNPNSGNKLNKVYAGTEPSAIIFQMMGEVHGEKMGAQQVTFIQIMELSSQALDSSYSLDDANNPS